MPQHSHTGNNFKLFFTFTNDLTISHDLVKIDRPYKKPKKQTYLIYEDFLTFHFLFAYKSTGYKQN